MAKFLTAHDVFDHISSLQEGSSILILDETRFESIIFLNSLFNKFGKKSNVILISDEIVETPFRLQRIYLEKIPDLTALSIEVDKYREQLKNGGVIIHNYLPHILVREDEERVLKLVESWRERIANEKIVEWYTMPKGSFPSFEGKIRGLLSGMITIKIVETDRMKHLTFQISGVCKPSYHMSEFPFMVKEERLLVKWGEDFTDKIFEEEQDQILRRREYIEKNLYSLRIMGGSVELGGVDIYERWLLTQCIGKDVADIYYLFPEKFDEVSRKLAVWSLRGIVKLEEKERTDQASLKKDFSAKTKLSFKLPTSIAMQALTRPPDLIPLDVYHALRKSVTAFITHYTPLSEEDFIEKLSIMEGQFQEMTARVTAVNKMIENRESPELTVDIRHLPKLLSISLYYGYHLKPSVVKVSPEEYEVRLTDCFLCKNIVSKQPVCHLLVGTMIGACGVLFKKKFSCREVRCKAMGDDCCTFSLRVVS